MTTNAKLFVQVHLIWVTITDQLGDIFGVSTTILTWFEECTVAIVRPEGMIENG